MMMYVATAIAVCTDVPAATNCTASVSRAVSSLSPSQVTAIRNGFAKLQCGDSKAATFSKLGIPTISGGLGDSFSDLVTVKLDEVETLVLFFRAEYGEGWKLKCAVLGSSVIHEGFRFGPTNGVTVQKE